MQLFILEEDAVQADLLAAMLVNTGCHIRVMTDAQKALPMLATTPPALVFLGQTRRGEGLEALLAQILTVQPLAPVVVLCGQSQKARRLMRQGAYDVICRPFNAAHLQLVTHRAEETLRLRREVESLQCFAPHVPELVGQSPAMEALRIQMQQAAMHQEPLLLHGPAGSGRELVARLLHAASHRLPGPFITCRLTHRDVEWQENALFGRSKSHETPRPGALERAQGGTLFLDDIAELAPHLQMRLLEALNPGSFRSSAAGSPVQLRLLACSAREDDANKAHLIHELPMHLICVPTLDERREDIPALIACFMEHLTRSSGLPACYIMPGAMDVLQTRAWPGHVRQLRNMVEQMLICAAATGETVIRADMLPPEPTAGLRRPEGQILTLPLRAARERFEREYLISQLQRSNGNLAHMARLIRMEGSALRRKLQRLSIDWRKR